MNVGGLLGSMALGGAEGYVKDRYADLSREAEDLRKQGLYRLQSQLKRDEIDYRDTKTANREADRRAWQEQQAKQRRDWQLEDRDWAMKHQKPDKNRYMDEYNALAKIYGDDQAKQLLHNKYVKKGNGVVELQRNLTLLKKSGKPTSFAELKDVVLEDPAYLEEIARIDQERKGSGINPFDNKSDKELPYPDPIEWAKNNKPDLFAYAAYGEQAVSKIVGQNRIGSDLTQDYGSDRKDNNRKKDSGKKRIKSDAGLSIILSRIDNLSPEQKQEALDELKRDFDEESYRKVVDALNGKSSSLVESLENFQFDLGDVANGIVGGVKTAGGLLGGAGRVLNSAEQEALRYNNMVGNAIVDGVKNVGGYTKKRIQEDWFGKK